MLFNQGIILIWRVTPSMFSPAKELTWHTKVRQSANFDWVGMGHFIYYHTNFWFWLIYRKLSTALVKDKEGDFGHCGETGARETRSGPDHMSGEASDFGILSTTASAEKPRNNRLYGCFLRW